MFSRDIPHEVLNYGWTSSHLLRPTRYAIASYGNPERRADAGGALKHPLAKRREVDVEDLANETFIGHIVESPFRRRVIELFAQASHHAEYAIEMPTIESIKRFVQMGMGVAIVPRMCVQWEIERSWMKEVKCGN